MRGPPFFVYELYQTKLSVITNIINIISSRRSVRTNLELTMTNLEHTPNQQEQREFANQESLPSTVDMKLTSVSEPSPRWMEYVTTLWISALMMRTAVVRERVKLKKAEIENQKLDNRLTQERILGASLKQREVKHTRKWYVSAIFAIVCILSALAEAWRIIHLFYR